MDLFKPVLLEDKLHPNFKVLKTDESLKNIINEWAKGFVDRDNKFVKEFQTTFNSSFWELYLNACFNDMEFKIDFSKETPDFIIETKNGTNIIIEAVTTGNADGDIPEYDFEKKLEEILNIGDKTLQEINQIACERILNAVSSKSEKYKKTYSKLEYVKDKPYIIAVGAYEQPLFFTQKLAPILKVCYGLEEAKLIKGEPTFEYTKSIIKRKKHVELPVGIFNGSEYSHISGILFSSVATTGKIRALIKEPFTFFESIRFNSNGPEAIQSTLPSELYEESLCDGLNLLLNPYAENPIDPEVFHNEDISIYWDIEDYATKHGALFARTTIRMQFNK